MVNFIDDDVEKKRKKNNNKYKDLERDTKK